MKMYTSCVLLIAGACVTVFGDHGAPHHNDIQRNGYIIHVEHICGPTQEDPTNLTITTDIKDLRVSARCKNVTENNRHFTAFPDGVHHFKQMLARGTASEKDCMFYKKENAEVYTVVIEIAYGEPGGYINLREKAYLVTCTYDENGINILQSFPNITSLNGTMNATTGNNTITIHDSYIEAEEIQQLVGTESNGTFTIHVVNILGVAIDGSMKVGTHVRLQGTLTDAPGALGVKATSCVASSPTTTYQVLRGGCGDGVVFQRSSGFTTNGLQLQSPFFNAFRLSGSSTVKFSCNFTVCMVNCDGSSCQTSRKKRDISNVVHGEMIQGSSAEIELDSQPGESMSDLTIADGSDEMVLVRRKRPGSDITSWTQTGVMILVTTCAVVAVVFTIIGVIACFRVRPSATVPAVENPPGP